MGIALQGVGFPVLIALLIALVIHAAIKTYIARSRVNRLRKLGLPMPPWSWVFGHLKYLGEYRKGYPTDIFVPVMVSDIAQEFAETDVFYLDWWPFVSSGLIVNDPNVAAQVTVGKTVFNKPPMYRSMFDPVMGGPNMLTTDGAEWKTWRSIFNPAFAHSYLVEQVPAIVELTHTFCRKLSQRSGTVFPLEDLATRLTMDVIFRVAMDDDLHYQEGPSPLPDSLRNIIKWCNFGNPFLHLHPIRPFAIEYYSSKMRRFVHKALKTRFEAIKKEEVSATTRKSKSVVALAMRNYIAQSREKNVADVELDATFTEHLARQIRLFLFAGHDSTTSIFVYTLHILSQHPEIKARVREEHTRIFGPDLDDTARLLTENPALLNEMRYTMAVIKETMRLYAPAGGSKDGMAGESLVDRHGTQYPTEGFHISVQHVGIHKNPRVWPRVDEFLPERWLVEEGHELYPPAHAFRAFEQGPRNCIGQNLSLIELRVVLAMAVRRFDIRPAYEEWDQLRPRGLLERVGISKGKVMSYKGERAYQVEKGAAHPAQGYPCHVTLLG